MHQAISQVEIGAIPFSLAAINIANALPGDGFIAIVGDQKVSLGAAQALENTFDKLDEQPVIAYFESVTLATKPLVASASVIVALKGDFATATTLVDVCCKTACKTFQISGVISVQKLPPWVV